MTRPSITVLSTAFAAPTETLCRRSVERQTFAPREHRYLDAARQDPPLRAGRNLFEAFQSLPAEDVIVHLDGDDWLAHREVLAFVAELYRAAPALWMTWGSYERSDGAPGVAGVYEPGENPRDTRWRLSHLKTFRAGLVRHLLAQDLQFPGRNGSEWTHRSQDLAVMFPLYELAGPKHRLFVPEILAVYHLSSSFEKNATPAERNEEASIARHFRRQPPKAPLEAL